MGRSIRAHKAFLGIAAMIGAVAAAGTAHAAVTLTNYNETGDSGTLRVTTYAPTLQVAEANLFSLYGTPTITPVAAGWKLTFVPSSAFFAAANNNGGGKETEVSGKLDFDVTFSAPIQLTLNVYEDGLFAKAGSGSVSVFGGAVVTALDPSNEQQGNTALMAALNPNGSWTAYDQVTGFAAGHVTYHISIDNDLAALALPNVLFGSANIAKKDFSIIITTDGSTGGGPPPPIPEPASVGVLALGTLGLLSRRRR